MYAAQACCCLGDAVQALTFLAGDEQEYAVDCLASDLGGITVETASVSSYGKRRLARAQSAVRSSASAVTAALGTMTAAKQLAMSAQAMEDSSYNNGNGSNNNKERQTKKCCHSKIAYTYTRNAYGKTTRSTQIDSWLKIQ